MLAFDRVGTGIPLVFVHAFPLSRRMWKENVSDFSRNFQVITIDLPGFGDSPLEGDTSTMESMARGVLQVLDSLKLKDKAIFAGVSMGGYVLFQIFRLAPQRVRALGLISTRAAADTDEGRQKRFKTIEAIEKDGLKSFAQKTIPNLFGKSSVEAKLPAIKEATRLIEGADPKGVCAALRGMAARPDSTALLSTINVPVVAIAGEEDTFIPSAEMENMARFIPNVEFHELPKAGHLLTLEQQELFREKFAHFLKRRVL